MSSLSGDHCLQRRDLTFVDDTFICKIFHSKRQKSRSNGLNTKPCSGFITFELITGYVYTSPSDTMELVPGTLRLTDCLALCNANATCQAINFETGLCVLFSSSAAQRPAALTPSQFPVFTIYAHKVCLLGRKRCDRDWMFERVNGYELRDVARSSAIVMSREACMELCLNEVQFRCRSANYNRVTGECFLSDKDRTSLSLTSTNRYFGQSSESVDYLESNCVDVGHKNNLNHVKKDNEVNDTSENNDSIG
ncbi:uncharacterized protein TNCT_730681 [Trichonephila clavata]|uniref:Apple domain-containing protein n=1 Tax=Trichonephila clavata TaxID=2740835 RepID=A0A8X6I6L8_TRICU|nr:uncharacterized protein TNCT_730681 [Trichonephila clavata]